MRGLIRRARTEDGFTLIELVISVAIMGMIVVPLTGVVMSYLSTTVDTQARLTESHDVQIATTYWQRDVASIGVRGYDGATKTFPLQRSVDVAPCGVLPAGATAVVALGWSEYTVPDPTVVPPTVTVTYATRPLGASGFEMYRVRCGSQPSTVRLARNLAAVPVPTCHKADGSTTACAGTGAAVPMLVKLPLLVHDNSGTNPNYLVTLTGERRQT